MKLADIMSRRVITVELDDRLHVVRDIFASTRVHHVLAVETDGTLYGVVSDRDLLRALSPFIDSVVETARDSATLNKPVHQIMTRKPLTLGPDADVTAAIDLLLAHPISCVPIVDGAARPLGIVTWRDLLRVWNRGAGAPAPRG